MSEVPPWARSPRAYGAAPDQPRTTRRVVGEVGEVGKTGGPAAAPEAPAAPPAGRMPPPMPAPAAPPAGSAQPHPAIHPATDQRVGVISGPVDADRPEWTVASSPGLVAAATAATLAIVAVLIRALPGDVGGGLLLVGVAGPVLVVLAAAVVRWLAVRNGSEAVLRFRVRAVTGRSIAYEMRCDASRDTPGSGDLVRVVTGLHGSVRAVEVLATLNGPVLRRFDRRPVMTPVQWIGVAVAAALLIEAVALLLG